MMFGFKNAKGGKVMELREVLKEQLNASHHENGWFVSLLNSIVNLSDEEADWKPNEDVLVSMKSQHIFFIIMKDTCIASKKNQWMNNRKKILFSWMKG